MTKNYKYEADSIKESGNVHISFFLSFYKSNLKLNFSTNLWKFPIHLKKLDKFNIFRFLFSQNLFKSKTTFLLYSYNILICCRRSRHKKGKRKRNCEDTRREFTSRLSLNLKIIILDLFMIRKSKSLLFWGHFLNILLGIISIKTFNFVPFWRNTF